MITTTIGKERNLNFVLLNPSNVVVEKIVKKDLDGKGKTDAPPYPLRLCNGVENHASLDGELLPADHPTTNTHISTANLKSQDVSQTATSEVTNHDSKPTRQQTAQVIRLYVVTIQIFHATFERK